MFKQKKIFFLIILFTFLYVYMINIDKIPKKIVIFQNEDYEISHLKGININGKLSSVKDGFIKVLTSINSSEIGTDNLTLSAFGGFLQKDIEVNVLPCKKVIVGGQTVRHKTVF